MSPVRRGFTLLEAVVAMAILAVSLMAIFDLNAGAIASHAYAKRLTVATMLARSKMTDIEQKLYGEALPTSTQEESGDFSDEGWSSFKWKSKVIVPNLSQTSPDKLMGALLNVPEDFISGALSGALGGGDGGTPKSNGPTPQGGASALGPMAGMVQMQFQQMAALIQDTVREVHLTVSWKEGDKDETLDLVTHLVSSGPNSDRNAVSPLTQAQNALDGGVPGVGVGSTGVGAPPGGQMPSGFGSNGLPSSLPIPGGTRR